MSLVMPEALECPTPLLPCSKAAPYFTKMSANTLNIALKPFAPLHARVYLTLWFLLLYKFNLKLSGNSDRIRVCSRKEVKGFLGKMVISAECAPSKFGR